MAVSRKPMRQTEPTAAGQGAAPAKPRVDVDAIINRGGSVARETKAPAVKPRKGILLNLPLDTLDAVADALALRPVKITRQTWIEEAIQEKLTRDKTRQNS